MPKNSSWNTILLLKNGFGKCLTPNTNEKEFRQYTELVDWADIAWLKSPTKTGVTNTVK